MCANFAEAKTTAFFIREIAAHRSYRCIVWEARSAGSEHLRQPRPRPWLLCGSFVRTNNLIAWAESLRTALIRFMKSIGFIALGVFLVSPFSPKPRATTRARLFWIRLPKHVHQILRLPLPVTAARGRRPFASNRRIDARAERRRSPLGPCVNEQLGITVWRLRPSKQEDGGARILVMENSQSSHWTPERIEVDTSLAVGDRVRISVESPRAGYLYVVDREQYADGTFGDPYLIFPTKRTRGGDNRVRPGKLIDIPAQEDNPSTLRCCRVRPQRYSG